MSNESVLVQCYNRGCGQKFDPNNNPDDGCRHHPGLPFFHDAYKGWSCCNKKCTDFTEFLNIKGCALSRHSDIKPPEPERPVPMMEETEKEIVEVKPMERPVIQRPPIDTPMVTLKPNIAASLKQQMQVGAGAQVVVDMVNEGGDVPIGTACKNSGCNVSYQGPQTNEIPCVYHSGGPIFHEGMKYWSCCQRKTTDFNAFLNQAGCQSGLHLWKKDDESTQTIDCRWDWHQTGSHVVVSIYAKNYCPDSSIVQLNPIRLFTNIVFPLQANATFTLDIELQSVIDVKASQVSMFATKVEIKLKKAEPGSWSKIEIPKRATIPEPAIPARKDVEMETLAPQMEMVDLSDL